jgi:beta-lactamase regulating signal transducer with metallopeptidase domain
VELLHIAARTSVEWMLYCLLEGSLLALFAWVVLRLLPRQNAGTRFALWFSVLLATIVLPFAAGTFFRASANGGTRSGIAGSRSLLTLPDSLAISIFMVWAVVAAAALLRVMVGLRQVHRIRRNSEAVDPERLGTEVKACINGFPRAVTLRTSDQVEVPAAIGFLRPAVVIPRWFQEEMSAVELQQVVLHELTHLRRRDDWSNLAQKIIKAVLFFHPFVWWVEQRLSLEREMACDDAVLAQSASPRRYAECLARLAEKTLVRRKISLAQAVVGRMRQLSLRIAQILDANRPGSTRIWKPAVPMVLAAAALCGFSAWSAPALVRFQEAAPVTIMGQSQSNLVEGRVADVTEPKLVLASVSLQTAQQQATQTAGSSGTAKRQNSRFRAVPGMTKASKSGVTTDSNSKFLGRSGDHGMRRDRNGRFFARGNNLNVIEARAQQPAISTGDYVFQSEQVVVTMSATGRPQIWQVSLVQVSIVAPPDPPTEAGKTVSRKKI